MIYCVSPKRFKMQVGQIRAHKRDRAEVIRYEDISDFLCFSENSNKKMENSKRDEWGTVSIYL